MSQGIVRGKGHTEEPEAMVTKNCQGKWTQGKMEAIIARNSLVQGFQGNLPGETVMRDCQGMDQYKFLG